MFINFEPLRDSLVAYEIKFTKNGQEDRYYISSTKENTYYQRMDEHRQGQFNSSEWVKKLLEDGFKI